MAQQSSSELLNFANKKSPTIYIPNKLYVYISVGYVCVCI